MNEWLDFLAAQIFAEPAEELSGPSLMPMTEHRLLRLAGKDAVSFLQGQLTCDVRRLENHDVMLGAHCNPKGRMISSFAVANIGTDAIGLRHHQSISSSALTALKKYIVFAKATLLPSNEVGLALLGAKPSDLPLPISAEPGKSIYEDGLTIMHHLTGLLELWMKPHRAVDIWQQLQTMARPTSSAFLSQHWIRSGIAEVQSVTSEAFIPQMFNYHLVDGVSFKKGCYTGQEIVARMQYRGQLKKHTYRIIGDGTYAPAVGTELVAVSAPERIIATVVASARGAKDWQGLVVSTSETRSNEPALMETNSGAKFAWAELPYAIP